MSPKLREILDEYCKLEYEKRGNFPVEVPIPFQLYRQVHPVYTWQSRQTRFVMQEESRAYPEPVDAADTSPGLPSGVSMAMEQSAARLAQQQAEAEWQVSQRAQLEQLEQLRRELERARESSYRIPMDRCGEEGCTVCNGPRVRESRDVPNDVAFFMNTERLGRDVFQRRYEPLPSRRNRRS